MYLHYQGLIRQALNFNSMLREITSTVACTEENLVYKFQDTKVPFFPLNMYRILSYFSRLPTDW